MIRKILCGAGALGISFLASSAAYAQEAAHAAAAVANPGNNAWMMTSTILVLMMILPGLALFYGGLTRSKNMLSTMTQIGATAALAMLIWICWGYSTAFGPEGNAFFAWGNAFLSQVKPDSTAATFSDAVISEYVFVCFQMTFAAITAALVLGGTVERIKFSAVMVFVAIWLTIVYFPIAHMVWAAGGLIFEWGALDFAGGTVVHINAGVSALVAAIILGKRRGFPTEPMPPHSLTLTMVGTGLLWVGWFGFNGGSALAADGRAGLAMVVTHIAAAAGALAWMLAEWWTRQRATLLGLCSGVVAGLVAITPAAGFVGPRAALLIGVAAGFACYWGATGLKRLLRADDSLDVFGVHGVGGLVGALLTGALADPAISGQQGSLLTQLIACAAVLAYSLVMTTVVLFIVSRFAGLRVGADAERQGLDAALHNERLGG